MTCRNLTKQFYLFDGHKSDAEKTKSVKCKELFKQFEALSISSGSSYEPVPKAPRIKLKPKAHKTSSKHLGTQVNEPQHLKEMPNCDDSEVNDPDFNISKYDWKSYKETERSNWEESEMNLAFQAVLEKMSPEIRQQVLIKNHLIDLINVETNVNSLKFDEFQKKMFHFAVINREWNDKQLKLYSQFWRRGGRP